MTTKKTNETSLNNSTNELREQKLKEKSAINDTSNINIKNKHDESNEPPIPPPMLTLALQPVVRGKK